jgi:hypothetical protein
MGDFTCRGRRLTEPYARYMLLLRRAEDTVLFSLYVRAKQTSKSCAAGNIVDRCSLDVEVAVKQAYVRQPKSIRSKVSDLWREKSLVFPAPLVVGGAVPPASREVDVVGRAPVERRVVVRRLHDDDEEAATS